MRSSCMLAVASLFASLLVFSAAHAQAPGWQMAVATATPSPGYSRIDHTATDASGNVLVSGYFQGTITLGSTTLLSAGSFSSFVAKWNAATSTWAWAQPLASTDRVLIKGLAVVGSSVYVSGACRGTTTIGSLSLGNPTGYTGFVAKLADAGTSATWVWAQPASGSANVQCYALAAQGTSVYITGFCDGPLLTLGTLAVALPTSGNTFVAKLTDSGPSSSYTWALAPGGSDPAALATLAVQGSSLYAAGSLQGTATFGSTTLTSSSPTDSDVLVTKITDAGTTATWAWAQQAGGPDAEEVKALAVGPASVYVLGSFYGTTALFGATTLANAGNADVFVGKLTDAGATSAWAWAQRAGGPGLDRGEGLVVRGTSVYVSGDVFGSPAAFGSTTLTPAGTGSAFVARLADAGPSASFAWAQAAGGASGFSVAKALSSSSTQLYTVGYGGGSTTFSNQTLPSNGSTQYGFLTAITDAAALPTLAPVAARNLMLFPNPAHSTTTVQLPAELPTGPATLTVLDAVGRVVRVRTTPPAPGTAYPTLDVAGLAPGVYALRVAVGETLGTARLVVE